MAWEAEIKGHICTGNPTRPQPGPPSNNNKNVLYKALAYS
jgi:hypothetical protein